MSKMNTTGPFDAMKADGKVYTFGPPAFCAWYRQQLGTQAEGLTDEELLARWSQGVKAMSRKAVEAERARRRKAEGT